MIRVAFVVLLVVATSGLGWAQRQDGCRVEENLVSQGVAVDVQQGVLRGAGYGLDPLSVTSALHDSRADVRSLAARELSRVGTASDLRPMMRAWLAEQDACTKRALNGSILELATKFSGYSGARGQMQRRITPFQVCRTDNSAPVVITVGQVEVPGYGKPAVEIRVRNVSQEPLPFLWDPSPSVVFSVTVLAADGERARVTKGQEWMYEPVYGLENAFVQRPSFVALMPEQEFRWVWRVGDDFDLAEAGAYRVSFGGRQEYLNATICSNSTEITVK